MRQVLVRLQPLMIVILYSLSAITGALSQESLSSSQQTPEPIPSDAASSSQFSELSPNGQHVFHSTSDGAELVEQALVILRALESTATNRNQGSSSVLISAWYLLKELIPRLYISGPPGQSTTASEDAPSKPRGPLATGVTLLEEAAQQHNSDAIYLLAQMNFYGNFTNQKNYTEAFLRYQELAILEGNSSAQHMIGFMYATGIGGAVEQDQAKALLYHTFAAQAGHTKSEMTVAFRHHSGIGTPRHCDEAVQYYKSVADKAIQWYRSGPPGGRAWVSNSYRLADEYGGVYGEGASVSSSGQNAQKKHSNPEANAALDDVLEYLELMSGKGDFTATISLGRVHYEGQKDLPRDVRTARRYFQIVASQYWKKDGTTVDISDKPGLDIIAGKAAGYLGRMFMREEGVERNYKKAMKWFQRGLKTGDAGSQFGLGVIYQYGLGVEVNVPKAVDYYRASAEQNYPHSHVALGALYLDQGSKVDIQIAYYYFDLAAHHGHIEALYFLAEMINQGVGRERSCSYATAYYKSVAERAEPFLSTFAEANQAYKDGNSELALLDYMLAAEQGYEKAQANVAYMLDEQKSMLEFPSLAPFHKTRSSLLRNAGLALIYWTRSAKQSNVDSMVKMGDYYLNGIGTTRDMEKAAQCYMVASESVPSAQALFNLGWMHENGVGLTQDFHLAKRYYDHALETNEEAYLPVTLSLLKLRARSAWNTLTHGNINSIHDEPATTKQWSMREWLHNFLDEGQTYIVDENEYDDDQLPGTSSTAPGIEEEYIDDGLIESLIIVVLAGILVWLVYYRQAQQLAHRRAEAAAQARQGVQDVGNAQQPEGGFFPAPGDPALPEWLAGGIGH